MLTDNADSVPDELTLEDLANMKDGEDGLSNAIPTPMSMMVLSSIGLKKKAYAEGVEGIVEDRTNEAPGDTTAGTSKDRYRTPPRSGPNRGARLSGRRGNESKTIDWTRTRPPKISTTWSESLEKSEKDVATSSVLPLTPTSPEPSAAKMLVPE